MKFAAALNAEVLEQLALVLAEQFRVLADMGAVGIDFLALPRLRRRITLELTFVGNRGFHLHENDVGVVFRFGDRLPGIGVRGGAAATYGDAKGSQPDGRPSE